MKKAVVLLVLVLLAAGAARAVVDPDPDRLGLYFDENADITDIYTFELLPAYLILTNPTFPAVKGIECCLEWDESACAFLNMMLPTGGMNLGDYHNLVMGLTTPLTTSDATVMATYNLLPTGMSTFTLTAAQPPSIDGDLPVVVDGDDNMFQIGVSGGAGNACAVVNGGSGDSQSRTWGDVKSLYR